MCILILVIEHPLLLLLKLYHESAISSFQCYYKKHPFLGGAKEMLLLQITLWWY